MTYVRTIVVRDSSGDEFNLYEFKHRRWLRRVRELRLDSGELVRAIARSTFVVDRTGEILIEADDS